MGKGVISEALITPPTHTHKLEQKAFALTAIFDT